MIDVLNEIHRLSRNCLEIKESLFRLEAKRDRFINKSKELALAYVGDEEYGFTFPIENEIIIKEIEKRRDVIESDYEAEKAKLIEVLEILKENESK